jgi:hypothetical protein
MRTHRRGSSAAQQHRRAAQQQQQHLRDVSTAWAIELWFTGLLQGETAAFRTETTRGRRRRPGHATLNFLIKQGQ